MCPCRFSCYFSSAPLSVTSALSVACTFRSLLTLHTKIPVFFSKNIFARYAASRPYSRQTLLDEIWRTFPFHKSRFHSIRTHRWIPVWPQLNGTQNAVLDRSTRNPMSRVRSPNPMFAIDNRLTWERYGRFYVRKRRVHFTRRSWRGLEKSDELCAAIAPLHIGVYTIHRTRLSAYK